MKTQPTRVCIVGNVCIDENSDEYSAEYSAEHTVDTAASAYAPGSPAVFMVREFDALSADPRDSVVTSILAAHGDDFERLSPTTPLLTLPSREPTLLYRNFFVDGRRQQECRNTQNALPPALDHTARAALGSADIVIVAPLLDTFTPEYLAELFASVSPNALRVLLPQGYFRRVGADHSIQQAEFAAHPRVLPQFDLVVYSDEDCDHATERAIDWSASSPGTRIVVTQGELGATAFDVGAVTPVAAVPISPVDGLATIGAGDVFSAHLTMAYFADRDLPSAVRAANLATARFLEANQASMVRAEGELLAG